MAKSRVNKNRKQKVNNFKQKQKKQMSQTPQQNLPLVRNVPVWENDSTISLKGFEWEAIQNSLGHLQLAQQAAQSVMSRNILEGVVTMRFEKLNPLTVQYEAMTLEEQAPYQAEFAQMIETFKAQQNGAAKTPAPEVSPIVSETGEAIPKTPAKKRAKVIKMNTEEKAPV